MRFWALVCAALAIALLSHHTHAAQLKSQPADGVPQPAPHPLVRRSSSSGRSRSPSLSRAPSPSSPSAAAAAAAAGTADDDALPDMPSGPPSLALFSPAPDLKQVFASVRRLYRLQDKLTDGYAPVFPALQPDMNLLGKAFGAKLQQNVDILIISLGAAIQNVEAQLPAKLRADAVHKGLRTLVINIDFPELADYHAEPFWHLPPRVDSAQTTHFMFGHENFHDMRGKLVHKEHAELAAYMGKVKKLEGAAGIPAEALTFGDRPVLMWYLNAVVPLNKGSDVLVKMVAGFVATNNVQKAAFINNIAYVPFLLSHQLHRIGLNWLEFHNPESAKQLQHVVLVRSVACGAGAADRLCVPINKIDVSDKASAIKDMQKLEVYDEHHCIELVASLQAHKTAGSLTFIHNIDDVALEQLVPLRSHSEQQKAPEPARAIKKVPSAGFVEMARSLRVAERRR